MKGNFRRSSKINPRHKRLAWTVAGALVAFYILSSIIGALITPVANIALNVTHWLFESEGTIPDYFRDRDGLIAQIVDLEEQLAAQTGQDLTISQLVNENTELRALLSLGESERVAASVIARPNQLPYDFLLIDEGSDAGIQVGAPVFAYGNRVIGRVERAYAGSALVALVTTPMVASTVYVDGPDIYTDAVGVGGGVLRVNVPQGLFVQKEDLVLLPSLGGIYGVVSHIESIPTEPEQYAYVTMETPIQQLRFVSVGMVDDEPVSFEEIETVRDTLLEQSSFSFDVPEEIASSSATSSNEATEETFE